MWKENAPKYGYEVVTYEEYAPRSEDYSDMILKAKSAGAEVLLTVPSPPDGLAIQKQMAELGWTPKFTLMIRAPENVSWGETLARPATMSPSSPAGTTPKASRVWPSSMRSTRQSSAGPPTC